MKAFRFPLERALHWRRTQLELEKAAMQRLAQRRVELELAMKALETQRTSAELSIARAGAVESFELVTMSSFQSRITREKAALLHKLKELERETAAQLAKTTEAQRRVRLLERLREGRLTEWTREMEGEQERFAAEAWLGRWPMLKQENDRGSISLDAGSGLDATRSPA